MSTDYKKILDENLKEYGHGTRHLAFFDRLYSDKTHFVFELLQNAEDAGAKKVRFDLFNDRLEFRHDGRLFNEMDVRGICGVGEGTKQDDLTQIGKFGIGFKSVYAYTKSPEIHSGDEHFKIENYVRPYAIPAKYANDQWATIFIFPFNNPNINVEHVFQKIENRFVNLNARTLLFLRNIKKVEYNIFSGNNGSYIKEEVKTRNNARQITVIGQKNKENTEEEIWLVFEREIHSPKINSRIRVETAFLLKKDEKKDQQKITKIHNSPLIVFFPTEKETRLGFLIQGPYRTTPARDNIPKDDQWNKALISETAELIVDALLNLKKMKLLSVSLLECLPIKSEDFPEEEMFYPIFEKIKNALIENDLLPTHNGSFINAKCAKLARADALRELLSSDQLQQLCLNEDCLFWLTGEITQDRTPDLRTFLIDELNIEEIRPETFARKITKEFLENQTDFWIIEFYAYISEIDSLWRSRYYWEEKGILRDKEIIRISDGTHIKPFKNNGELNAFLPPTEKTGYPEVKKEIIQDERAFAFLEKLGLRQIGEKEAIQSILQSFYINGEAVSWEDNIQHINKFIKYWKKFDDVSIFTDVSFLIDNNKEHIRPHHKFYLDSPFLETGLQHLFEVTKNDDMFSLWEEYNNIEGFSDFAIALGVKGELTINKVNIRSNSDYWSVRSKSGWAIERCETIIEDDYLITNIEKYLSAKDVHISRLIWDTAKTMDPKFLEARYRPNRQYDIQYFPSQLIHFLKEKEWIPTKKGDFVKPSKATNDDLLEGFIYDDRNGWLTAIDFGCKAQKTVTKKNELSDLANFLGIKNEKILELLQNQNLHNDPNFEGALESYLQSYLSQKSKPAFPERNSANPDRRKERLENTIPDAPDKKYEDKKRSVRTSSPDGDPKVWLKNQYTNDDEQLICQICQLEMPFKKPDGEYYFEDVEIFDKTIFDSENEEVYLALCPICSAKYKIYIKKNNDALNKLKESIISSESPEIDIDLDTKASIRFVETHFQDLKTILRAVKN